jgi:hypothetical protein
MERQMAEGLIANVPILYGSVVYQPGDRIAGADPEMARLWLEAGTARHEAAPAGGAAAGSGAAAGNGESGQSGGDATGSGDGSGAGGKDGGAGGGRAPEKPAGGQPFGRKGR